MLALIAALTCCAATERSDLTPQQVIAKAVAAREAITSFEFRLHLVSRHQVTAFGGDTWHHTSDLAVWSAGDKLRADSIRRDATNNRELIGIRRLVCRNCERQGYHLHLTEGRSGVYFYPSNKPGPSSELTGDYRTLGYLFDWNGSLKPKSFREDLESGNPSETRVVRETTDGVDYVVLRTTFPASGATKAVWVRPDQGDNVVRLMREGKTQDVTWKYETTSTLEQEPASGVWFPKRVHVLHLIGGVKGTEWTADISAAKFNHTVPPATFTLAGIKPPVGTSIEFPDQKSKTATPTWQNGKVDYTETIQAQYLRHIKQHPPEATPVNPPGGGWWWTAGGAVVLAGFGVWLVRRAVVGRRS